jgi:hypothetical protein
MSNLPKYEYMGIASAGTNRPNQPDHEKILASDILAIVCEHNIPNQSGKVPQQYLWP